MPSVLLPLDNDIPLPEPGRHEKYPFRQMEIGQSFFLPCAPERVGDITRNVLGSAWARRDQPEHVGRRYKTRRMDGGLRIWRVA